MSQPTVGAPHKQTLLDLLRIRAEQLPHHTAFTYLVDGEAQTVALTYAELDGRARAVAGALHGHAAGARALIMYDSGLDFIASFFGCVYAGLLAVPVAPPRRRHLQRLEGIVRRCDPVVVLGPAALRHRFSREASGAEVLRTCAWVDAATIENGAAVPWREPRITGTDGAVLQFTSGSTAAPRGVLLTHANLLHNQTLIQQGFQTTSESSVVGWLPLHHDMGLVGTVLHPVYMGIPCTLLSPVHFMERPIRWLQAISRSGATVSGGPNFAFELSVRRTSDEERAMLDLSRWQVAFNGAEPVRPVTLRRFASSFASAGFRFEAFRPCYGLAEASLFVAGTGLSDGPVTRLFDRAPLEQGRAVPAAVSEPGTCELVGYQLSQGDHRVLIVDPERRTVCPDGDVGEIWVCSPSVGGGYWNEPSETERVFNALTVGADRPFLTTGDLGFVRDGWLFVTGRRKDLIILRGRNLHPQDIEDTAQASHSVLRTGGCAVFSVEVADEERIVAVHEIDRQNLEGRVDEVANAARGAVADVHDLALHDLVFVSRGAIPRTTSGKVQRSICRSRYLDGTLHVVARSAIPPSDGASLALSDTDSGSERSLTRDDVRAMLRQEAARLLGVDEGMVSVDVPLVALGLDSLMCTQLHGRLEKSFAVRLSLESLLGAESIETLCGVVLAANRASAAVPEHRRHDAGAATIISTGQRALWFLSQLESAAHAAQLARAVRISGPLDAAVLRRALDQLVERHDVLTTRVVVSSGEPTLAVCGERRMDLSIEDASRWSQDTLSRCLDECVAAPLNLEHGPPARAWLFRLADDTHVLLLSIHHAVTDFWSLAIMLRDLQELYTAERLRRAPQLPAVALTFADYARLEQERLGGSTAAALSDFWRQELDGAPLVVELPADRARPAVQSFRGAGHRFAIEPERTAHLRTFASSHSITLFTVLVSSFLALLHRYTGQTNVLVGMPVTRREESWRDVVGYFTNLLPLRGDFSGDPTFTELVSRMQSRIAAALAHGEWPFSSLVERLRPGRDPSRPPVVQYVFNLLADPPFAAGMAALAAGSPEARLAFGDLSLAHFPLPGSATQFDLAVTLGQVNGGLSGWLEYNPDLFDEETARELTGRWQAMLAQLTDRPSQRVSRVRLLSATERAGIEKWNPAERTLPFEPVHRVIEASVDRWANVVASDEVDALTFADLNRRANHLARRLQRAGVRQETPVALCTRRSLTTLIGTLAVMKAGGAYVPLDPAHPPARTAAILADCAAPVLVTDRSAWPMVPAYSGEVVFAEPDPLDGLDGDGNLRVDVDPDQAAYVIYTSGSTGTPNGVVVTHRALLNLLLSMKREPGLGPADRLLSVTTIAFDIAALELFLPLVAGAHLKICAHETAIDGQRLRSLLSSWNASVMQATPATWRLLLDTGWPGMRDLVALCGGEALPADLADALSSRCAALWNMYGPTETTIWSMTGRVTRGKGIALGRPIDNTQVYVLDRQLEPCPVGVAGELHIAGAGLARGYWGRPDLTASRFVPHPFSRIPGARLYCTGDRARFCRDGRLEFLGRRDDQIKIRGYRIELGEVEAALRTSEQVEQVAVVAVPDSRGDQSLVAYVVFSGAATGRSPATAQGEEPAALRTHVKAILPAYMIPSRIVPMRSLPMTPNRKVDRRALPPAPPASHVSVDRLTGLEADIASIWRDVLGVEKVGLSDNFFDLGGHSLLLNRVRARLEELLNRPIPLLDLFRQPTVHSLAESLRTSKQPARDDRGTEAAVARRAARPRQRRLQERRRAHP